MLARFAAARYARTPGNNPRHSNLPGQNINPYDGLWFNLNSIPAGNVSKAAIRFEGLRNIERVREFSHIVRGIPLFSGIDNAARRMVALPEFEISRRVLVSDYSMLHEIRFYTLINRKSLYIRNLPEPDADTGRVRIYNDKAMYWKVQIRDAATRSECRYVLTDLLAYNLVPYTIQRRMRFQFVVITSLMVTPDGQRIGNGTGYEDLYIGLLIAIGSINSSTIIATVVNDNQIVNTLPSNIFADHDVCVDIIITPTKVLHCNPFNPRPAGVLWDKLREDHLIDVPQLRVYKEHIESLTDSIIEIRPSIAMEQAALHSIMGYGAPALASGLHFPRVHTIHVNAQPQPLLNFFRIKISNIPLDITLSILEAQLQAVNCSPANIEWIPSHRSCALLYPPSYKEDGKMSTMICNLKKLPYSFTVYRSDEEEEQSIRIRY